MCNETQQALAPCSISYTIKICFFKHITVFSEFRIPHENIPALTETPVAQRQRSHRHISPLSALYSGQLAGLTGDEPITGMSAHHFGSKRLSGLCCCGSRTAGRGRYVTGYTGQKNQQMSIMKARKGLIPFFFFFFFLKGNHIENLRVANQNIHISI